MSDVRDITFQFKRGTALHWTTKNPVLATGEPGFEVDTGLLKVGDGVNAWNSLPYVSSGGGGGDTGWVSALAAHVNSTAPHPVYDDGPSLALLYQNQKEG